MSLPPGHHKVVPMSLPPGHPKVVPMSLPPGHPKVLPMSLPPGHPKQGWIQDFVGRLGGGPYRDGNGGVPLQTCQSVWESAVRTIIPAPKP